MIRGLRDAPSKVFGWPASRRGGAALVLGLWAVLGSSPGPAGGLAGSVLKGTETLGLGEETALRFLVEGPFAYTTSFLSDPQRFVCELRGVTLEGANSVLLLDTPTVDRVRMESFERSSQSVTRLVFYLNYDVEPRVELWPGGLTVRVSSPPPAPGAPAAVTAPQESASASRPSRAQSGSTAETVPSDLPATTPWLVTHQGERIAIKGGWRQRGGRIVFTRADGTLSSIRASEVDVDASLAAGQQKPVARPRAATTQRQAPVLVITDKDLPGYGAAGGLRPSPADEDDAASAPDSGAASGDGAGDGDAAGDEPAPAPGSAGKDLKIVAWQDTPMSGGQGIEVFGTLQNNTASPARQVEVKVLVYDESKTLLESVPAQLAKRSLPARGTVNFRAAFPTLQAFHSIEFEVQAR